MDTNLFYDGEESPIAINRAKRICEKCTVRGECLQWALEFPERYGVWGGMTTAEREPFLKMFQEGKPFEI